VVRVGTETEQDAGNGELKFRGGEPTMENEKRVVARANLDKELRYFRMTGRKMPYCPKRLTAVVKH
jgi:hypothetical protein